ncbi:unnamed protein product [Ilex paraguariensis]|uniref:Uncharacterized protein n=1 Tax=Ilex paraguariensis TaxID=185542 RepID=A0ABC8RJT0_9AQUA
MDIDQDAHSLFTPELEEERDQKEDRARLQMWNTDALSMGCPRPPPSSPLNKPLMIYSKIINDREIGRSRGFRPSCNDIDLANGGLDDLGSRPSATFYLSLQSFETKCNNLPLRIKDSI